MCCTTSGRSGGAGLGPQRREPLSVRFGRAELARDHAAGRTGIVDAFFLDARQGWAVMQESKEAGSAEWMLAHTADGGSTWTSRW